MPLIGLKESALKLILFGGKGGVGKTTCAVSTGVFLAKEFKTLLLSTDPAHSISDSLGQQIGDSIKEVKGIKNLWALEINADKALSEFKTEYAKEIREILDTSTNLDKDDIESVFSLSIPGLDEVMGFKTVLNLMDKGEFDKYIIDTAPTGHALRLLTMPQLLDGWIKMLAKIRWKYRYIIKTFSGRYVPDKADDFLLNMKKMVKKIGELIKDENRCEFIGVTIPEDMAIQETSRLIQSLSDYGVEVKQLVINNVMEPSDCKFCRERRKEQEKYISRIKKKFANLKTTLVFLRPREVKGMNDLNTFGLQLASQSDLQTSLASKLNAR
ncbi:MAG: ArsA family ATPase [Elusimicrobia bacterium]|nr:ArsA family ATPase [Elusimicrobiota bacterium]